MKDHTSAQELSHLSPRPKGRPAVPLPGYVPKSQLCLTFTGTGCTRARPKPQSCSLLRAHWARRRTSARDTISAYNSLKRDVTAVSLSSRTVMTALHKPDRQPQGVLFSVLLSISGSDGENPSPHYGSKEDSCLGGAWLTGSRAKNKWRRYRRCTGPALVLRRWPC